MLGASSAMEMKTLLRTFLIAEVIIGVSYLLIPEPDFETHTQAWEVPFGIVLFIVEMVSRVGLFFFWRPARPIFLATIVADLVATAFTSLETHIGICASLNEASVYL